MFTEKSKKFVKLIIIAFVCFAPSQITLAQDGPVAWTIKNPSGKGVKPGEKFNVQISASISGGWYIYSLTQSAGGPTATRISVPAGQPFSPAGAIGSPKPKVKFDENFQINTESYSGGANFTVPVQAASETPQGKQSLRIDVRFQACNATTCLPPKTLKLETPIEIIAALTPAAKIVAPETSALQTSSAIKAGATPTPTPNAPVISTAASTTPLNKSEIIREEKTAKQENAETPQILESGNEQTALAQNSLQIQNFESSQTLLSFIWLAMTMGALSLLTPCVFPMIPITVSYFTRSSAENSRLKAVRNASIYSLGIILTFTALGVLLAFFVGAAGINRFASSPLVNLLITAIFVSFALSLFGFFHIGLPSGVLTRLESATRQTRGSEIIGLILMGITFTLTSFTCTAPFVGTLLVMTAAGDWQLPLIGMLAFSTVFAIPFFVLALAPQLLSQLPKAGEWLNSVKVVMGLLEIAAAMKFLSNVDLVWHWGIFTREVVLISWTVIAIAIAAYLLSKLQFASKQISLRFGVVRLIFATSFLTLGFYLITGLFGHRLGELESFLPPVSNITVASAAETEKNNGELDWITNDYEKALSLAKAEKKLLFIDFTGYTCTNCRWMEANMFTRGEVRREMEQYVRVRLYTDGEGDLYEKQQQLQESKFGTVALPFYAIVDAEGRAIATFAGLTRDSETFANFLKRK